MEFSRKFVIGRLMLMVFIRKNSDAILIVKKQQMQQYSSKKAIGCILCRILLQLEFDAVNKGLPGRFDNVFGDADRTPN